MAPPKDTPPAAGAAASTPAKQSQAAAATPAKQSQAVASTPGKQSQVAQATAAASEVSSPAKPSSQPNIISSTSGGSNSASAASATASPHASSNGNNTGMIAGIAVLAVLLAIALAAIAFLIFRKKRKPARPNEYEPSYEQKTPLDPASAVGMENLESDVKTRDNKIRELQAALLKQGRGTSDVDDRQIRTRFTALSQNINDWVMTYFKGQNFSSPTSSRTIGLLRRVAPGYEKLLQDPRMKYLVIRAVVMENVTEAFMASEFIANIPFNELNQGISRHASPEKANEWRALTVPLLQTMPDFEQEKVSSVQEVTARIESMIAELVGGLGASTTQGKNLQMIVDYAAELSVKLGKQQATYVIGSDQVGSTFDSDNMEDVSQAQGGRGRAVQAVVFPSLVKGAQPRLGTVISKAQVVI